ncbi:hypothetical protein Efla_005316 [Eimeria flavescens]
MAPLSLPLLASACAFLAGFAAAAPIEVTWPENGAIKFSMTKAPPSLKLELPDCLSLSLDFGADQVQVSRAGQSELTILSGSEKMKPEGGQVVVLFNLENSVVHVIAYVETPDGSFDSRMSTLNIAECPLTMLRVSSATPADLKDMSVFVSEEIEQLYRKALGFETDVSVVSKEDSQLDGAANPPACSEPIGVGRYRQQEKRLAAARAAAE